MNTEPRFQLMAKMPTEVELPSYVKKVEFEDKDDPTLSYQIPQENCRHKLCNLTMVNPLFPRLEDNPMGIPLLMAGCGYAVSKNWLEQSPLCALDVDNVHILSGDWYDSINSFSWCGSGLNRHDYLLLSFTICSEGRTERMMERTKSLTDQLSLKCVSYVKEEKGNGLIEVQMVLPLVKIDHGEVVLVDKDSREEEWNDRLWKLAQLENFRLQLDYDHINTKSRCQYAWLVDPDGKFVPATLESSYDERFVRHGHFHWSNVKLDDLFIYFYEIDTDGGNENSEIRSFYEVIGGGTATVWQRRTLNQAFQSMAEMMNDLNEGAEMTSSDVFEAVCASDWDDMIRSVDEQYSS